MKCGHLNFCIQSEYCKMRIRVKSEFGHFLHSGKLQGFTIKLYNFFVVFKKTSAIGIFLLQTVFVEGNQSL